MRGGNELVQARLRGVHVNIVAISLTDAQPPPSPIWLNDYGHAFIEISSQDPLLRLDLRGVRGLPVVLVSNGDDRWLDVLNRLVAFDPVHVAAHNGEYAVFWTKRSGLQEWGTQWAA